MSEPSTRLGRIGILWRGDDVARRSSTPETSRFKAVFAALADVGVSAIPVVYEDDVLDATRAQLVTLDGVLVWVNPIHEGRNRANLARSRAAYDEAVAGFRQQVLVAFREVQDALTATRYLGEQSTAQDRALAAARRSLALVQVRYDAGYVSYFEVIDAERTALAAERASVALTALRLNTSVALIKSLGGGWHAPADSLASDTR